MTVAEADAREFRANASFCEDLGKAACVGPDRDLWVQMKLLWLVRAANESAL
jgi:hypothetical protein